MTAQEVLDELRSHANPRNVEGMARYGIQSANVLGVTSAVIESIARRAGRRNHDLAAALWDTGVFEARMVAAMIDDPAAVTARQMERWVSAFDSWAMCDGICNRLFVDAAPAWAKAVEWTGRDREYVKRAGFVLMTQLAVHDRHATDEQFLELLPLLVEHSDDDRQYVKKAVNWALRQIGKRNVRLNRAAVDAAETIRRRGTRAARWIASDALRELTSEPVRARLAARQAGRKNQKAKSAS
jgi:3-methyladenine DNA glycosylase AlkD